MEKAQVKIPKKTIKTKERTFDVKTGSIDSEDIEDLRKSYDRLWGAAEEIVLRLAAI